MQLEDLKYELRRLQHGVETNLHLLNLSFSSTLLLQNQPYYLVQVMASQMFSKLQLFSSEHELVIVVVRKAMLLVGGEKLELLQTLMLYAKLE